MIVLKAPQERLLDTLQSVAGALGASPDAAAGLMTAPSGARSPIRKHFNTSPAI